MSKTFVLVHGAWHGGWCWSRLTPLLEARGFRIIVPTCTGLGDRAHLLSADTGLETFIADVVAAIEASREPVILVGHSFAGSVITAAADRIPERIAQLVYLDAAILRNGESHFGILPPEVAAARRQAAAGGLTLPIPPAAAFGITDPTDAAWLTPQLTPHPLKTYEDKLCLDHPIGNGKPKTYIACTDPEYAVFAATRRWVRAQPDWIYKELATGHDAMVTAPGPLADMLLSLAETQ